MPAGSTATVWMTVVSSPSPRKLEVDLVVETVALDAVTNYVTFVRHRQLFSGVDGGVAVHDQALADA